MKRLVTASGLIAFSLLPLTGAACDAYDEAMATATPPAALASAPPAASKVPAAVVKPAVAKVSKQTVAKPDVKTSDPKVAAASN
jgi:hypothetical protein